MVLPTSTQSHLKSYCRLKRQDAEQESSRDLHRHFHLNPKPQTLEVSTHVASGLNQRPFEWHRMLIRTLAIENLGMDTGFAVTLEFTSSVSELHTLNSKASNMHGNSTGSTFWLGIGSACIAMASDTDRNSGNLILGMEMGPAVTSEFTSSPWT